MHEQTGGIISPALSTLAMSVKESFKATAIWDAVQEHKDFVFSELERN